MIVYIAHELRSLKAKEGVIASTVDAYPSNLLFSIPHLRGCGERATLFQQRL